MIRIDPSADVVTVINTCEVAPEHQDELAELWAGCMPGIRSFPGFRSASIHKSEDRRRVVVYLQWASREGHDRCLAETWCASVNFEVR